MLHFVGVVCPPAAPAAAVADPAAVDPAAAVDSFGLICFVFTCLLVSFNKLF